MLYNYKNKDKGAEVLNFDKKITDLKNKIVEIAHPLSIVLFSQKKGMNDELISFKLCIVIETEEKIKTEHEIYMKTESEIPFDIILYTEKEWAENVEELDSFAHRIEQMGWVLYEK